MSLMRKVLLAGSTSPWLRNQATRRKFVRRSVSKFMPGERFEDALAAAVAQSADGIRAIFTQLGENLTSAAEAETVTQHYLDVLDRIAAVNLDGHIAVKPTQLGLDYDMALCERNLDRLIARAEERNNFVWLDMESSPYVDPTLALFRRTRAQTKRIGVALQAYLHRTPADIDALLPLGSAIRLVKGAYLEPPSVAIPKKADVDEAFYQLACRLLSADAQRTGTLLHIATHDIALGERLLSYIDTNKVPRSAYEFAMLYGIQREQQLRLARTSRPIRVLIAYGEHWFPWYMRRLAERPANVWFVMKNLFG
jgi:proline dehydrogenase